MVQKDNYQFILTQHQEGVKLVGKLRKAALTLHGSIFFMALALKKFEVDSATFFIPALFVFSLFFLIKDFIVYRRIDGNMTHDVLKGLDFERRKTGSRQIFS